MAPTQRQYDAFVELLAREGSRFGFFGAVRTLHQLSPGGVGVGELGPPHDEPVRFRHDPSLVFHASDVASVTADGRFSGRAVLTTTFLGLVGASSPLATTFTEDVLRADAADETSLRAFYDVFHHRLVSLFYRTWKKYRWQAGFRADGSDTFTRRMMGFVGVDLVGATPTRGLPPFELLSLASLLLTRSRPARTLELVLERLFPGIPAAVRPFALRRVEIREDDRVSLGKQNHVLGQSFTIGASVSDRSARFRVVLGPVDYQTFEDLMPGGARHARFRDVVLQFAPPHLEPELELVLDEAAIPRFRLGRERGGRLGVTTQLPTKDRRGMRARVVLGEDVASAVPRIYPDGLTPDP